MRWLTFHFIAVDDGPSSFDLLPFGTADEAVDMLQALFAEHRSCRAVEIFDDGRLILRAERPANDPPKTATYSPSWRRRLSDYDADGGAPSSEAANRPLS